MSNTIVRVLQPLFSYRVITSEQNTYVLKTFAQKLVDKILSYNTFAIVAVSQYVADFTAKQEHINRDKFTVITNGTDVSYLQQASATISRDSVLTELNLSPNSKVIINIGQFIFQKNQELLIEAFARFSIQHPDHVLLILGEGAKRQKIEAKIKEFGLQDKVLVPGIKKNVWRYLTASDFFVLSSRFEGFPIVVVEALACGLPIISTPVSGSDEYVVEGKNGWTAEANADALAAAMSKLANLPVQQFVDFRKNSIELSQLFDISKTTQSYEHLIEKAYKGL